MASQKPVTQTLNWAWGCVGVALLAVLIGFWALNTEPKPEAVKCSGEVMSPGDVCHITRRVGGHVREETKSYEEVRQDIRSGNIWVGRIALAGAALLVVASVVLFVQYVRATKGVTFTQAQHTESATTWAMGMGGLGLAAGITAGVLIGGGLGWLVAIGGSLLLALGLFVAAATISEWRFKAKVRDAPQDEVTQR